MPTTSKLHVVEDDDNMNLAEFLSCYGYLLKQPGGWRFRRDLPILGTKQRHLAGREIA